MASTARNQVRRVSAASPKPKTQRTNGAAQNQARAAAAKKRRQRQIRVRRVVVGVIVLAVVAITALALTDTGKLIAGDKTFAEGVTIEGVNVGGMTLEAAMPSLEAAVKAKLTTTGMTLEYDGETYPLSHTDLGLTSTLTEVAETALDYDPDRKDSDVVIDAGAGKYQVEFHYDEAAIAASLQRLAQDFYKPATEPSAEPNLDIEAEEHFTFVEGADGRALDVGKTTAAVVAAIKARGYNQTCQAVVNPVPPTRTLAQIQANTQLIASYTTEFKNSSSDTTVMNRVFNIRKAAGIINGMAMAPGEVFSFNEFVGLRTSEGGWKDANGISGGKEYTLQPGGGICQVSTTLYNALLCGNVKIVYRRAHSIPSDYVPLGLDATVDSSGIDFQFENDTGETLYVFMRVNKTSSSRKLELEVSLYGKPLPEGITYKSRSEVIEVTPRDDTIYKADPAIPMGYQLVTVVKHDGYRAEAYVDKYVNGKLDDSRLLQENKYKGNPAEISVGTGDTHLPAPVGATLVGNTVADLNGVPVYVDEAAVQALLQKVATP